MRVETQQTFQRCFNVVFWLIWRRDVEQRQINAETTLCISTLEFTTSNNVESTLRISTLMWTTLDNVEATLSFSTSSFTTLVNVETMLWKWPFPKRTKKNHFKLIHWIQSFNCYFIILFALLPILRGIYWRILAQPQKLRSWKNFQCRAFAKIVKDWKLWTIFTKSFILGAWQGSKYASVCPCLLYVNIYCMFEIT